MNILFFTLEFINKHIMNYMLNLNINIIHKNIVIDIFLSLYCESATIINFLNDIIQKVSIVFLSIIFQ